MFDKTRSTCCALLLTLCAFPANAGTKHSGDFDKARDDDDVDVIVRYTPDLNPGQLSKIDKHGGRLKHQIGRLRMVAAKLKAKRAKELAGDKDVAFVHPDREVGMSLDCAAEATGASVAFARGLSGKQCRDRGDRQRNRRRRNRPQDRHGAERRV
jgi:hypothetical protein